MDDLARRVPELNRKELVALAQIGALNSLGEVEHRRDALWQVEWAGRPVGPLLRGAGACERGTARWGAAAREKVPAEWCTAIRSGDAAEADDDRGAAGGGLCGHGADDGAASDGVSPRGVAGGGNFCGDGAGGIEERQVALRIAGCVIARQRPGTAKGFVFLSLEDETGIANVILTPDVFERDRLVVTRNRFLRIEGPVQNQEGVIHVKAQRIVPLEVTRVEVRSRDFR